MTSPSSLWQLSTCVGLILLLALPRFFTSAEPFESLLHLPRSGSSGLPGFRPGSAKVLHLTEFGAAGDGIHDDTEAFKNAWKVACSLSHRSKIVVPKGSIYLVRPIDFCGPCRSEVILKVLGTIIAPRDPDVWEGLNPRKWLYFRSVKHLSMEGGGAINGMGEEWWARSCKVNTTNPCHHAPTAVTFHRCKDLKVRDLSIVDSQQMHLSFTNCIRVDVSGIKVHAPVGSPNTDGIHISSSINVKVTNSVVETGDDCFSIVGNSSRILIAEVSCGPGHGISIGSLGKGKSCAQVHDVMVDGAYIANTENGLRIKTWQGGSGSVTKITFQNVWMQNVSNPILVDQYYCDSRVPCLNQSSAVQVDRVSFIGIKGTSATEEAIRFSCSDLLPCQGLYLEGIQLVSNTGFTTSFCWEALGSSSGLVFPPPCFSTNSRIIKQHRSSSASVSSS